MARITSQKGQGSAGGVLSVEKLFETTVVQNANTITATLSPVVILADYAEFWFILTGSIDQSGDIFAQINNLTSSSYGSFYTHVAGVVQTVVDDGGSTLLHLNHSPVNVTANQHFYSKVVLQGGNPVNNSSVGSIFTKYFGVGAGNDNNYITGAIELQPFSDTTLDQWIVTVVGGEGALFLVGTKLSIYGVKTA